MNKQDLCEIVVKQATKLAELLDDDRLEDAFAENLSERLECLLFFPAERKAAIADLREELGLSVEKDDERDTVGEHQA